MTLKTCERDPNDIKIAIFFQKKFQKNHPAAAPRLPFVIRLD